MRLASVTTRCLLGSVGSALAVLHSLVPTACGQTGLPTGRPAANAVRVATFNTSLFRSESGRLTTELQNGSPQADVVAEIMQAVDADVWLLNEFDYDDGAGAKLFVERYLQPRDAQRPWSYFSAAVNTGVDSGLDLDGDGRLGTAADAWGYGVHPGQYGMLVISRWPIEARSVRTFQRFPWHELPEARRPVYDNGTPYYRDEIWEQLRLSSKSHWDVPIDVGQWRFHFLVSHPTPPVFDGAEDRNGRRNADEIRFWQLYTGGGDAYWISDDRGRSGGLRRNEAWIIAGDLNNDPVDGDGIHAVISELLALSGQDPSHTPSSVGAAEAATRQGGRNLVHEGDSRYDTADFADQQVGNIRCDYVLPSPGLEVIASGVVWPTEDDPRAERWNTVSDHHAVWIDVRPRVESPETSTDR